MNLKTSVTKKQSVPSFLKNECFLPSYWHMGVCISEGKKYLFFWKFGVLCLLVTPVLRFALLSYNWQIKIFSSLSETFFDWVQLQHLKTAHVIICLSIHQYIIWSFFKQCKHIYFLHCLCIYMLYCLFITQVLWLFIKERSITQVIYFNI